jgi:hypothetical protein
MLRILPKYIINPVNLDEDEDEDGLRQIGRYTEYSIMSARSA